MWEHHKPGHRRCRKFHPMEIICLLCFLARAANIGRLDVSACRPSERFDIWHFDSSDNSEAAPRDASASTYTHPANFRTIIHLVPALGRARRHRALTCQCRLSSFAAESSKSKHIVCLNRQTVSHKEPAINSTPANAKTQSATPRTSHASFSSQSGNDHAL